MNVLHKLENHEAHSALEILHIISFKKYDSYLVGGCVRDLLLDKEPKDFDIATNAPINVLEEMFDCYDIGKSKDFGIVSVRHNGINFEVANFRSDGEYSDKRRPDSVVIESSFEKDVLRRDFTINALGIDLKGNIVDFVDGINSINSKNIKTVGDPYKRFSEDPLRVVRGIRFAGIYGFGIDRNTKKAMKSFKNNIQVSLERIHDELYKMASGTGEQFVNCIKFMDEIGVLDVFLPEVSELKKFSENVKYHPEAYENGDGSVFSHVMSALSVQTEKHKPLLNLAILFHDLGKAKCYTFCKEKSHRYSGHAHESVELIENVCNRLKFSNNDKNALIFAAKEHMNLHTAHKMKRSSIFKHFNSEHLELLIDTVKCDDSCRLSAFNEKEMIDNVNLVRSTLNSVDSVSKERKKIIDGKIVMSITGEPQSKLVGDIIKSVTNDILDSEKYVCTVRRIKDTHNQMK